MTGKTSRFRWVLALVAGVLAEIGVFAIMPIALRFGPAGPLYIIPPAAFALRSSRVLSWHSVPLPAMCCTKRLWDSSRRSSTSQ
jgi:hypothetical protein